jgi:phosphoserine phosphatase RsbU/P
MRKETYRKGDLLFKRGDKADRMFYLHQGAVRLPEIKKTINAGQVIGELGLFSPRSERTASAICEEDLEAYSLGRKEVIEFLKEDPSLTIELMQMTFKRLLDNERMEAEARERLESELRIAREIQMSMLPRELGSSTLRERVAIEAIMQPAKEVGGDFYDYFATGPDQVCVLIGDASGKGVPAAMFVAVGKALLKAEARRGGRPHQIVTRVNRALCHDNSLCMFITLLCIAIDTRTAEVECCCAGHDYPLLRREGGGVDVIELPAGKAIGVLENARYRSRKLRLKSGDTLFAYTDGVTEAVNPQQQCYSRQRLIDSLASRRVDVLSELLQGVKEDVEKYQGSEMQADDITLAAVRLLTSSGQLHAKHSRAKISI